MHCSSVLLAKLIQERVAVETRLQYGYVFNHNETIKELKTIFMLIVYKGVAATQLFIVNVDFRPSFVTLNFLT